MNPCYKSDIEAGLSDLSSSVVITWITPKTGKLDKKNIKPTLEQVNSGLFTAFDDPYRTNDGSIAIHKDWSVAAIWASRQDYPPTADQIAQGFSHADGKVRMAWSKRRDFTPTHDQISAGIKDELSTICTYWMMRRDVDLCESHIELLMSEFDYVTSFLSNAVLEALNGRGVKLNKPQIERLINSPQYNLSEGLQDFIRQQIAEMCSPEMVNTQTSKRQISL